MALTRDNEIHIDVQYIPSSAWVLDGNNFFCAHDNIEIVNCTDDYAISDGYSPTDSRRYACAECAELLDGDPVADDEEHFAEMQAGED